MLRRLIAGITVLLAFALCAQDRTYSVGDRVEALDVTWYKGTVTQIGSGTYQGYYMVKYDEFNSSRWFAPKDLKPGGPPAAPKTYATFNVGDKVEAYEFGWQPGTVTQLGSGTYQGHYLIKYEKFSSTRWFHPKDLRSASSGDAERAEKTRTAATASQGPRPGKYNIYSYGAVSAQPLYLGHLEILAGGKYRVSRTSSGNYFGEGTFTFDSSLNKIVWNSGPYAAPEWSGAFSVEGATHRIALRSRTIATNTAQ